MQHGERARRHAQRERLAAPGRQQHLHPTAQKPPRFQQQVSFSLCPEPVLANLDCFAYETWVGFRTLVKPTIWMVGVGTAGSTL
eukprot:COSAG06_NODE_21495_length_755_cov_0.846037_2_plen_84_part_00